MHQLLAPVAVLLCALAAASPVSAEPLDRELRGLLVTHPEILARQRTLEAARAAVAAAGANYLPKFEIYGQTGPQYIDSPVMSSEGGGTWLTNAQVAGARLSQTVFDGFATPAQVRQAELNVEVADFTLYGTQQNVLLEGMTAYVEVLRQRQLATLARDSERTIQKQLRLEDERVLRGSGIAVDVLQAKSRLQVAKERRVGYEGALADAVSRYVQVFDHLPATETMQEPALPEELLPRDLDQALRMAEQENPAIDSSLASVAATEQRKRLARSGYYPSVSVVASANHEKDIDLVQGTRIDYSVMLQASWNLFDGFATSSGVDQAAQDYEASRHMHSGIVRKVMESTRLAWHQMTIGRERVALLENAVTIATEVFDSRRKLREAGRETVINVLDAENEVLNARINLTVAKGDVATATYRLLQSTGQLRPDDVALPGG